ncbi:Ku protein [Streptomyces sp. NPDC090493]|uniref:non-homologous end joining protein Ku n=1 Tax=Streptomyces sp. NPDC090493 TaxID=3365964 RepID=UPI0038286554
MVIIPVTLTSAVERGGTPLHWIHTADGCNSRIRYRRYCSIEDREVDEQEIGRGWETPTGDIITIKDEELDNLPLATAHTIELLGTLPVSAIDPLQIGAGAYYLTASTAPAAVRPYLLLVEVLARRDRAVVVKFAVRGDRERLGLLRSLYGALVLDSLRWSDEIRPPVGIAPASAAVTEEELEAALDLIEARSVDTLADIPDLTDRYAEALAQVVDAKLRDITPNEPARHPQLVDLMDALRRSASEARTTRGDT